MVDMSLVELNFKIIIDADPSCANDIGEYIAYNLLSEMYNGENITEVNYTGFIMIEEC